MNRRAMFKALAGVTAAAGVPVTAKVLSDKPALIVLECDASIGPGTAEALKEQLAEGLIGTPLEGVKAVVLADGVRMRCLDARGAELLETDKA